MSYIAFDLDALNAAPNVARAAHVPEDAIIGGLLRLWAHAFRRKVDELDQLEVRGCFDSQADVLPALKAFGFLAEAPEGRLRVRGAERYLRISEARSRGGKSASRNLKRGNSQPEVQPELVPGSSPAPAGSQPGGSPGSFPALTPNTEHRTPNTYKEDHPPPPKPIERGPIVYVAPDKPSHQWGASDFFGWAQAARQGAGWVGEPWPRRSLSAWWSEVTMTPGMEIHRCGVDRLRAGFLSFAQDEHWRKAKPPAPFTAFMATWRNHVPPEIPGLSVEAPS